MTETDDQWRGIGIYIHDSLLGSEFDRPLDLMTESVVVVTARRMTHVRHFEYEVL